MVYVDRQQNRFGRMKMSHLIADTSAELHAMADVIGVQRKWFQSQSRTPHYDICQSKKVLAIKAGAVEVGRNQFVTVMRRNRARG